MVVSNLRLQKSLNKQLLLSKFQSATSILLPILQDSWDFTSFDHCEI